MYILPLIEVKDGESVHLFQTPGQGEARPLLDPVEVLMQFQRQGAQGFHVVDVDRARESRNNDHVLVRMVDHTRIPIQAGGGVESMVRIQELLDTGIKRVLVGTMGVLNPRWLDEASKVFQDKLVACVDVRGEDLLVKGRTAEAPTKLRDHVTLLNGMELGAIHFTNVDGSADAAEVARAFAGSLDTRVSYQGPVASEEDLAVFEQAGVAGVVLGPELYEGRLSFPALAKRFRLQ